MISIGHDHQHLFKHDAFLGNKHDIENGNIIIMSIYILTSSNHNIDLEVWNLEDQPTFPTAEFCRFLPSCKWDNQDDPPRTFKFISLGYANSSMWKNPQISRKMIQKKRLFASLIDSSAFKG